MVGVAVKACWRARGALIAGILVQTLAADQSDCRACVKPGVREEGAHAASVLLCCRRSKAHGRLREGKQAMEAAYVMARAVRCPEGTTVDDRNRARLHVDAALGHCEVEGGVLQEAIHAVFSKSEGAYMAVYRQRLDALQCTICHVEHRPEITRAGGVTVTTEFCAVCHSLGEQDVRTARPSRAALSFDTCASAGCHNYHDNRALYEDFLTTHGDSPWGSAAAGASAVRAALRSAPKTVCAEQCRCRAAGSVGETCGGRLGRLRTRGGASGLPRLPRARVGGRRFRCRTRRAVDRRAGHHRLLRLPR